MEVGEEVIDPDSPRLFALALYLAYSDGRLIHKSELCELLFPDTTDRERASHNLRQLLYRLRRLGVKVHTSGDRVSLPRAEVTSSFQTFAARPRAERISCRAVALAILPAYEPRMSRQFSEWIESVRVIEQARLRTVLRQDFAALEQSCDWDGMVTLGRTLQALHMASEDVLCGMAQALALRGHKHDALEVIDSFLQDSDPNSGRSLRQLRTRIARAERPGRALESAFHGRRAVMQDLGRQWEATLALVPQLAIVTGPAGIGKTRLAQEFSSFVQLHGGQCLYYRCERSDSARPYALFRGILPQLRRMRGSLGASPELRPYLDRLSSDSTIAGAPESVASEAMRADIRLALVDLFEAVSTERPVLLVVDDAQLQDSASTAATRTIVASGAKAGVMIIWCNRTPDVEPISADHALRGQVHRLSPLSAQDSLAVLSDLLPDPRYLQSDLAEWAGRAGGNPYYLHAMAYSLSMEVNDVPVTFDIQRFAATAYYALGLDARAVFDTCILLGPFATLQRVSRVAEIHGQALVGALRDLEANGMVCAQGTTLRCAHALLEEASMGLIPHLVATLLRTRIARELEEECGVAGYPADLSWAAADHCIALGDIGTAARLLRRCASQAAALGEPAAAAKALLHIPVERLELSDQAAVLSELAEYCATATEYLQAASALRSLRRITLALERRGSSLREIDLRIAEAELHDGADPRVSIPILQAFVKDPESAGIFKVRAGAILLVAADMDLNNSLAHQTYNLIGPELAACPSTDYGWQRAELVFHTVFGDRTRALAAIDAQLRNHATPDISQAGVQQRRNIAYSLVRLGLYDRAKAILRADFEFMTQRRVPSEATYRVALLSEIALNEGDIDEARRWLGRQSDMVAANPDFNTAIRAGYYSNAAELALFENRFVDARKLADQAHCMYPAVSTPRYAAIALALQLRIEIKSTGRLASQEPVKALNTLYCRGACLGMQDEVVEALWLAASAAGQSREASRLLLEYLTVRRREIGPPRQSLRSTTATDSAWAAWPACAAV